MATTLPYSPPKFTDVRSRLAVLARRGGSGTEIAEARADLAVVQMVRTIDHATNNGTQLDPARLEYLNAYLSHRLAKAGA